MIALAGLQVHNIRGSEEYMRYTIFIFGLILGAVVAIKPALAIDAINGKALFEANCARCHGKDATGSTFGNTLKPFPARNLRAGNVSALSAPVATALMAGQKPVLVPKTSFIANCILKVSYIRCVTDVPALP